jgi:succinoglycan biosynthesis transport protein ExoP
MLGGSVNALGPDVRPVLRRWPLIALVTRSLSPPGYWAYTTAKPTWTATTALTTHSQNREPEQDAVLSIGYVDYFNQDTYQQLRAKGVISSDVVLNAATGAASRILYIEAVAPTADRARSAASTFRSDIRDALVAKRQQEVNDLQA